MPKSKTEEVIKLIGTAGILRPRDLDSHGIPREYLVRLCREGLVQRVGRGLYSLMDVEISRHHTIAEACKKVPNGIICLLSALRFHDLTTQAPFEVWMAIDRKARKPKADYLPLRIMRFSGSALDSGIEEHRVEGVPVRVFNPAKTVADCFKYRNKIGLDVAMEALRECWRDHRCSMDELWNFSRICRVSNAIRPYLESLP